MHSPELADQHFNVASDEAYLDGALTRSVRLVAEQRRDLGYITPELKAMILDEELTPVLEVVVDQTNEAYGVVPRSFRVEGDDLIDPHGQSVTEVVERGRQWSRQEAAKEVPGAWRELQRRTAEAKNVVTVAEMPAGSLCIEVSANPIDWTPEEKAAQHYTGLTMVRASLKPLDSPNEVIQFNFVLPSLDNQESILNLQDKLGIKKGEQTVDTQEMLANPLIKECSDSAVGVGRELYGLLGATLLEKSVGHSTLQMIKRAIDQRREAWQFITAEHQLDVHNELIAHIDRLSLENPELWEQGMAGIRTGFTRELKDRFLNRQQMAVAGSILEAAASRAVADGDVYIACGMDVKATSMSRDEMIKSLRENVTGNGHCSACGASGLLFGCGYCGQCNKKWCDAFSAGTMLSTEELAYQGYSRPVKPRDKKTNSLSRYSETLGQYWQRLSREDRQNREAKKHREAEKIKLMQKVDLANAA